MYGLKNTIESNRLGTPDASYGSSTLTYSSSLFMPTK